MTEAATADLIKAEIARVPNWRHKIVMPGGVVTPGTQNTLVLADYYGLPKDLTGKRVLDIGCSDGFYSFECEKRGAASVLAIDDFSSVFIDSPAGFHVAHKLLNSKVEFRQMSLFDLKIEELGQFDLVLFLGVLYHLRHPLLAIEKLAEICNGQLILETMYPDFKRRNWQTKFASRLFDRLGWGNFMVFYGGDDVNRDPTNWWAQSPACVRAMLQSSGFCDIYELPGKEATFHAYHPRRSKDVDVFVAASDPSALQQVCKEVYGSGADVSQPAQLIRNGSIPQFAAVKQRVAELKAKQWHQVDRWRNTS